MRAATSFPIVFIGTSLGGFWANYFAHKYDTKCVLVNPSISPSVNMAKRVGVDCTNYATGEPIVVTLDIVAQYVALQNEASEMCNGALINLFLAMDDDILDYRTTLVALPFTNTIVVTETGGHRYESKWPAVVTFVRTLLTTA